ncbi:MAG: Oxidoreductase [Parcubacteria group bacterium GW2011_GWA2_49_16]|nr:MAG: Oxidoreductase [Parcubacteria group bacterium GW2011_GWA2_49_16]
MDIKKTLQVQIQGTVEDDAARLQSCANDASIFEIKPEFVVTPKDMRDLRAIVNFVRYQKSSGNNLSLTPRAAGTGMSGESLSESIVLDMAHFNHIKEVGNNFAITEPNVYYRDFEAEVAKKGLLLPSYTASKKICTVGGMVANNSAGEKTLSYGPTARYVERLKVVLRDGNEYTLEALSHAKLEEKKKLQDLEGDLYRRMYTILEENYDLIQKSRPHVNKNAAGYALWDVWDRTTFDLTKLFTGSQGTLGIITEINFHLIKPKPYSELLVIFLKDLTPLGDVVNRVLPHKPESFEAYDDHTLALAQQFLPEITESFGDKITSKIVLLAEFTGDSEEEVLAKAAEAKKEVGVFEGAVTTTITRDRSDAERYWTIRRESFSLLRTHGGHERTAPIIEDIIVRPEYLPSFLPRLYEILDSYGFSYTIAGHIGDGNLHIMPRLDFREEGTPTVALELVTRVLDLVFEFKGSMSAEHNDGIIRTPFLERMYGRDIIALFEEAKKIFDPDNIFNPGKKVFGKDITFIKEYIDKVY